MFPKRAFFVSEFLRQLHVDDHVQIAVFATLTFGQTLAAHAKFLAIVGAGRNVHFHSGSQCRHRYRSSQDGFPRRKIKFVVQVGPIRSKVRMGSQSHP